MIQEWEFVLIGVGKQSKNELHYNGKMFLCSFLSVLALQVSEIKQEFRKIWTIASFLWILFFKVLNMQILGSIEL